MTRIELYSSDTWVKFWWEWITKGLITNYLYTYNLNAFSIFKQNKIEYSIIIMNIRS